MMTIKDKKEFLKRYRWIDMRIAAKMEEIERMENSIFPGARILSGIFGSCYKGDGMRKTDTVLDKLEKMCNEIMQEISGLKAVRDEIMNAINAVPDETLKHLLEERYINFHSWWKIAQNMNYSEESIYKLHRDALKKLRIETAEEKTP